MGQTVGLCRLCLEQRELVEAHIIPRSFWPLDEGTPKVLSNTSGIYPSRKPTGVYDSNILCGKCDNNILGPLDQHAAETLLRGDCRPLNRHPSILRQYPAAEAGKIHLFIASVTWRASISNHSFFKRIKLGRYEDVIRRMILSPQSEESSVEVVIAEFDNNQGMLDPHQTQFGEVLFNVIYAERFVFYVKTDQRPCPKNFVECVVNSKRPVVTIPRSWIESKERALMQQIARSNPRAFPRPR